MGNPNLTVLQYKALISRRARYARKCMMIWKRLHEAYPERFPARMTEHAWNLFLDSVAEQDYKIVDNIGNKFITKMHETKCKEST